MSRLIIIDIETSGLDPRINGMLSLGAVDYLSGHSFYGECGLNPLRVANPKALKVNGFTEEQIRNNLFIDISLLENFYLWLDFVGQDIQFIMGGHNIGHFDILFLEEIHSRAGLERKFPFSYRTVDLHTLAYAKFGESLTHEEICIKLGLEPEPKPHNALSGAHSECAAIRKLLES